MKKLLFTVIALVGFAAIAKADRPISKDGLPVKAKAIVDNHFGGHEMVYALQDDDFWDRTYEVGFSSGAKIEFDRDGDWTEIRVRRGSSIPAELVPALIRTYVAEKYPNSDIWSIEKDEKGYEVKVSTGEELKFNRALQFMGFEYED